jgi:hypothetical protein
LFEEFIDYHLLTILLLCEFIDYRCTDQAVKQSDAFVESPNGRKRRKETTKGLWLLVKWKIGSEAWIPLKDAKETFPVQVAEFAVQVCVKFRYIRELTQPSVAVGLSTNVYSKLTKAIRIRFVPKSDHTVHLLEQFTSWNALPSY